MKTHSHINPNSTGTIMSEDFGSITIESPHPQTKKTKTSRVRKTAKKKTVHENEQKEPRDKRPTRLSRRRKSFPFATLIVSLCLAVALYASAGFFGVPYIVTHYLPKKSEEYTSLVLDIARAQFNPFTFELKIFDTTLSRGVPNNAEPPLLFVPSMEARIAFLPLFRGVLVSHNTTIESPSISLIQLKDGSYNFSSGFEKGLSVGADLFTLDTLPVQFSVNNIVVTDGSFNYRDVPAQKNHHGENIELSFPTIGNSNNLESHYIEPSFSGIINGSPVHFSGNGQQSGDTTKILCQIEEMDIPLYFSYLPTILPFTIDSGTGSGSIEIAFNPKATYGKRITLGLMLDATDLSMTHHNQGVKVNIESAKIEGTLQPFSADLQLKNLILTHPTLFFPAGASLTDLAQILPAQPALETTAQQHLVVQNLEIKNAELLFGQASRYQQIHLQLADYDNSATSTHTTLAFSGKIAGSDSSLSWQGTVDKGGATGQFKTDSFPITQMYARMGFATDKKDRGQGTIQGLLSFSPQTENSSFSYNLRQGRINFTGVQLHSKGHRWLTSPEVELSNIELSQTGNSLGDIVIQEAAVQINVNDLPNIFTEISSKDPQSKLSSLQLAGSLNLTKGGVPPLTLSSLSLRASELSSSQVNNDNVNVTAQFSDKATISAKGRIKLFPFALWLSTDFTNLDSQIVLPWLSLRPIFAKSTTRCTGKGIFTLPNPTFKGEMTTNSAHIVWDGGTGFDARKLSLKKLIYIAKPASLNVAEIEIDTAKATWLRRQNQPAPYLQLQQTLTSILRGGVQKQQTASPVHIGKVTFTNGVLNIVDSREMRNTQNRQQRKSSFINNSTSLTSLHSPAKEQVLITSSGELQGTPLKINGTLGLAGKNPFFDATASFQNLQVPERIITSLTGAEKNAPVFVDVKVQRHNEGTQLSTITEISSREFFPANSTVALILALNRDDESTSTITFLTETAQPAKDLVLSDTLEMKLKKLMVKAEISPFLLTIKDFNDLVGKESVEFRFGEIALTGQGMETLIRLRDFLTAHPYINLQIRGEASPVVDRQALEEQLTETEQLRVDKQNQILLRKWNEAKRSTPEDVTVDGAFTEENIFIPLQPETVFISDDMLFTLAQQRVEIIKHIFTKQLALPENRIEMETTDVPTERSANIVHFKLTTRADREDDDDPFNLED